VSTAGIAGLYGAVYARECGYQVVVFEKNERSDGRSPVHARLGAIHHDLTRAIAKVRCRINIGAHGESLVA